MKRQIYFFIGALASLVLVLGSCNLGLPDGGDVQKGSNSVQQGSISIKVQPVSPAVLDLYQRMHKGHTVVSKAIMPKAFLGAGKVVFTILNSSSVQVGNPWTVFPTQTGPNLDDLSNLGSKTLPAGSYTLIADVYSNSQDVSPSVTGSQQFTVTAGQSASANLVTVVCFPANPGVPLEGTATASLTLPTCWVLSANPQIGSEVWFMATPTNTSTNFTVTPDPASMAQLQVFLFDQYGSYLMGVSATSPGGTASISAYQTSSTTPYYIGVIDVGSTASPRSFKFKYEPYTIPAEQITADDLGFYKAGTLTVDDQTKWYYIDSVPGTTYKINWDDIYEGSGTKSVDIEVSAFHADQLTEYFTSADSGWMGRWYYDKYGTFYPGSINHTETIIAAAGESKIYFKVQTFFAGDSGSYALRVAPAISVAVLYAVNPATGAAWHTDTVDKVKASFSFATVDSYDVSMNSTGNPKLQDLQNYKAILIFVNQASLLDNTGLGNTLKQYVDGGGGVVVAAYCYFDSPGDFASWSLQGTALSGYLPFTSGFYTSGSFTLVADDSTNPILRGVDSFSGGTGSWHNTISLATGAHLIAHWDDSVSTPTPLIAAKSLSAGRVVGLNMLPYSSDADGTCWDASTDGDRILANALIWAGLAP